MTEHPTLGWSPERTWVFIVGILKWKHAEPFPPMPNQDRRDAALDELFRALGVPAAQIVYLQDRHATMRSIQQSLEAHLAKAGAGDLLVLYYCGHADKTEDGTAYFASYDTDRDANQGWVMDTIPVTVERCFGGSRALLLADTCYSGSMADAVTRYADRVSYACLTSSLSSEQSTGNWTFTDGLLAGLSGQSFVDADGENAITLRELAEQITSTMAFAEEQIVTFKTTGDFDPDVVVASARPRPDQRVGKQVAVFREDGWHRAQIIAVRDERVKVHYYGYKESDDEWVPDDRIRAVAHPIYPVGAAVEVKWKRKWYLATILNVHAGIHYIQYENHGPEWNEWVALKRIRPIT